MSAGSDVEHSVRFIAASLLAIVAVGVIGMIAFMAIAPPVTRWLANPTFSRWVWTLPGTGLLAICVITASLALLYLRIRAHRRAGHEVNRH